MNKLLLLEDDPNLSKTLIKYLTLNGYQVDWAKNGEEAIDLAYDNKYALYLFDINVPLMNGVDVLTALREAEDFTPTIIISALIDIESVTKGFIAGADDYVKKPFDPEELLIRIKAKTATLKEKIKFKAFEIDLQSQQIFYKKEPLHLGNVQKNLLVSLIKNSPNPVTQDELLLLLDKPTDVALRVNIAKLKKLFDIEIQNVRGVGYKVI
ncbi:response regulator transcription factor [bacterium]|nr:response regulator transcription factor [bacterium]MBU1958168.1 response regulator transcription factor [bacterium]